MIMSLFFLELSINKKEGIKNIEKVNLIMMVSNQINMITKYQQDLKVFGSYRAIANMIHFGKKTKKGDTVAMKSLLLIRSIQTIELIE